MKYLSVCSGIEAATVAWHSLGWEAFAYSEIESFPSAVLAHHYPNTPNLGDMTKFKDWPDATIDILVGGTPCQSFSVAGLRKGLADPRGNLMLTYLAIAARYRPTWLVWENVPGVLSSNGGRDFGTLLAGLGELGYGFAYRVLDAQYFGVAQRRRRVFVVGCLGDWRAAAAVLFERHSLSGNIAPSRQAGQDITPTIRAGAANGGKGHGARSGDSKDELIVPVAQTLRAQAQASHRADTETYIPVAATITAHAFSGGAGGRPEGAAGNHFIPVETLCVATGQAGAEIGADMAPTLNCNHEAPYIAHTLRGQGFDASIATPINTQMAMRGAETSNTSREGVGIGEPGHPGFTLQAAHSHAVQYGMQVRRLTPRECERLQGFPDDYTAITIRKKPAADGPRYKALGNSMAVPVMHWIGRRIQMVSKIEKQRTAA